MADITQSQLKMLLHYDPNTGVFMWRKTGSGRKVGAPAGNHNGPYIRIGVNGSVYSAHRLAVLYMTGKWPVDGVDHDDRNKHNNRWSNLQEATAITNGRNRKLGKNNTSGCIGVCWNKKEGVWWASIKINGSVIHGGSFKRKTKAISARKALEKQYKFHSNHGGA